MHKILLVLVLVIVSFLAYSQSKSDVVSGEHGMLNIKENKSATFQRTSHPNARIFSLDITWIIGAVATHSSWHGRKTVLSHLKLC